MRRRPTCAKVRPRQAEFWWEITLYHCAVKNPSIFHHETGRAIAEPHHWILRVRQAGRTLPVNSQHAKLSAVPAYRAIYVRIASRIFYDWGETTP